MVSPDGALLFLPKTKGLFARQTSCESDYTGNSTASCDNSISDDTKSVDSKIELHSMGAELSSPEELFPGDEYKSAIIIGNDLTLGGDKTVNGFSSKGWNPHLITASIRQAETTLR